jgi:drug/metabolite transporter (DMT)-like permease
MDKRTGSAMAFTVVSWASAFPAIRVALKAYTPAQLGFFRFTVAGLLLLGIGAMMRLRIPAPRDLLRMAALGVLGIALYALGLGYGQKQVPAGSASLLIASSPVWMVLIAAALGRERPSAKALLGIGISFAGVALIAGRSGAGLSFEPHAAAVLGAAIAAAAFSVAQRGLVLRYGALRVTIGAVWGGTLALLPAAGGLLPAMQHAPLSATLSVLYLAVVPGALGYAAWAYVSARASAAAAGSALYFVPAVSMLLSHLLLGEVPSAIAIAGGALVLAGVAVVHRRAGSSRVAAATPQPVAAAVQRAA